MQPETRSLQNEPVLRQIRKTTKKPLFNLHMAKKLVKTYFLSNAAARNPEEIVNKLSLFD